MNVTVDNLAPCKKLLRVEVDAEVVDKSFGEISADFQKYGQLPGFRKGKAPKHMVLKAYSARIQEEVKRKLLSESFREAVQEHKLHLVGSPEFEEVRFERGQPYQYNVTVETAPEFELPDYLGLPLKREMRAVTDEDVTRAVDILREQRATYIDVDRAVQMEDFVVVNYQGTCEGKPITETAPTAKGLTEKKDFWLHVTPDSFIPGFTEQLIGAKAEEQRTVQVDFPADFVAPQLAGKKGAYEVEIVQVKEKDFPEATDEFAKGFGAEDLDGLLEGVRGDLEAELKYAQARDTRNQLMRELLARVQCELPESIVLSETKNVVYDLVRENTERGISREIIDQQKDQIFAAANTSAKDRIKGLFILGRIADQEGIKATKDELSARLAQMSQQYNIEPEKLVKKLQERNGLAEVEEQIVSSKVLDFLEKNAKVETVLPPSNPPT